jgi:hypothetical protein
MIILCSPYLSRYAFAIITYNRAERIDAVREAKILKQTEESRDGIHQFL